MDFAATQSQCSILSWPSFVCFEARFLALKRFFSYDKPLANGQAKGETAVSVR
jgi:hypothetical protein